jgi:hypothetical protein
MAQQLMPGAASYFLLGCEVDDRKQQIVPIFISHDHRSDFVSVANGQVIAPDIHREFVAVLLSNKESGRVSIIRPDFLLTTQSTRTIHATKRTMYRIGALVVPEKSPTTPHGTNTGNVLFADLFHPDYFPANGDAMKMTKWRLSACKPPVVCDLGHRGHLPVVLRKPIGVGGGDLLSAPRRRRHL